MPTIKLHYDGWLALPAGLRQALGLSSGDRIEAQLIDGALVLRPAAKARSSVPRSAAADHAATNAPEDPVFDTNAVPVKRKPGRPRKAEGEGSDTGARAKPRGRPRASARSPVSERAAPPLVSLGPPKLIKKAALAAKAAPPEPAVPAVNLPRIARPDRTYQPVERRPFRNVEIRPLGPGRGHNRRPPGGQTRQSG